MPLILRQQPINLDATVTKINLLAKNKATAQEWIDLAKQVAERYAYYPLPMHSLMKLIEQKGGNEVIATVETIRIEALNAATSATESNVGQADACRTVANKLLEKSDKTRLSCSPSMARTPASLSWGRNLAIARFSGNIALMAARATKPSRETPTR